MPKIRDIIYNQFKATINYSVKNSVFIVDFKDQDLLEFANPEGFSNYEMWGTTEDDVVTKFQTLVRNYLEKGIKKDKCLAIEIESSWDCNDDIYRAGGTSSILKLQWCVVNRIMVDGVAKYKNDAGDYFSVRDSKVIPWTEKREAFLKQMTSALQEMSDKVQNFFKEDNLENRLDSNTLLLRIEEGRK